MTPEGLEWYKEIIPRYSKEKPRILDVGSMDINGSLKDVTSYSEYISGWFFALLIINFADFLAFNLLLINTE